MVTQHQFFRMRFEVDLLLEVGICMDAYVMTHQRDRNNERDERQSAGSHRHIRLPPR